MRHKHVDLIHAWAEGAEIECKVDGGGWVIPMPTPPWCDDRFYFRIKPEPKPDVRKSFYWDTRLSCYRECLNHCPKDDFVLVFDAETGKLKSAEVIHD